MTEQERKTQSPQQRTTNTRSKTTPMATSELSTAKQPTVESTTVTRHLTSEQNMTRAETTVISSFSKIEKALTGVAGIRFSPTTRQSTYQGLSTPNNQGLSNEILVGGIAGGMAALISLGLLLLAMYKRRQTSGLVLAQSNTETSFDNLGFTGGRKISEYMDLTELELVRVKVTNTVKRKISAFTKEDEKTRRVPCGRLELVEVPANTTIDNDVFLTTWV